MFFSHSLYYRLSCCRSYADAYKRGRLLGDVSLRVESSVEKQAPPLVKSSRENMQSVLLMLKRSVHARRWVMMSSIGRRSENPDPESSPLQFVRTMLYRLPLLAARFVQARHA